MYDIVQMASKSSSLQQIAGQKIADSLSLVHATPAVPPCHCPCHDTCNALYRIRQTKAWLCVSHNILVGIFVPLPASTFSAAERETEKEEFEELAAGDVKDMVDGAGIE